MKLIIQHPRIVATATDDYAGPETFIDAPPDFDVTRMDEYRYIEGALALRPDTRITKFGFRSRFTLAEKVTMELASLDNPSASLAQRQQAATLRVSLADTAAAAFIDLTHADTRAGVQMLESAGLLSAGRALVILDAPLTAVERP